MEQYLCSKIWELTSVKTQNMTKQFSMCDLMRPLEQAWHCGEEPGGFDTHTHIATPTLWVQKLTQDGKVKITNIPGAPNPADLGTKHLDGGSVRRALERCHCYIREGRSGIAVQAEVQEITRSRPEVFTFDDACEIDTQSETEIESGHHSKWCKPTVNGHGPLHNPNLSMPQCNATKLSDVSQTTVMLNIFCHDSTELFAVVVFFFFEFSVQI